MRYFDFIADKDYMENTTEKKHCWFVRRIINLKTDKILGLVFILHLILAACHVCHSFLSDIHYHGDLRTAGCVVIALLIFILGRRGMAFGFMIYGCSLIYVNTFYNYGSIFMLLIAFGAYPKIKYHALVLYAINVVVSFTLQRLLPFSVAIHFLYLVLFWLATKYVYKVTATTKLSLSNDERRILDELLQGKMQKEIDLFSPQTITAKIKSARERNMCGTTSELLAIYSAETGIKLQIGKCGKPCKKNCPKRDICECTSD